MIQTVNISPLPIYGSLAMQSINTGEYHSNLQALRVIGDKLPPFQAIVGDLKYVNSVFLVSEDTKKGIDITQDMVAAGIAIKKVEGFSILEFPSNSPIRREAPEGMYYLSMTLSNAPAGKEPPVGQSELRFSEVFNMANSIGEHVEIQYGNSKNLEYRGGIIDFADGFKFRVLLPSTIGRPKYSYEEEGKSRSGYTFIERITSIKQYQFEFLASESLIDALRIVKLCDNVLVKNGERELRPISVNMDVNWQTNQIAQVIMEISVDDIVTSLGQGVPE